MVRDVDERDGKKRLKVGRRTLFKYGGVALPESLLECVFVISSRHSDTQPSTLPNAKLYLEAHTPANVESAFTDY